MSGKNRAKKHSHLWGGIGFTIFLLGLVIASMAGVNSVYPLVLISAVVGLTVAFHLLFSRSLFFNIIFINGIIAYFCFFSFFIESCFQGLNRSILSIGFLMPLVAFLIGAIWQRHDIRKIIISTKWNKKSDFIRAISWLFPVMMIGVVVFMVHDIIWIEQNLSWFLLAAMFFISLIVLFVSRDISLLLMDTGVVFKDFLNTAFELLRPIVAFMTIYSLNIMVFAAIYRLICYWSNTAQFIILGDERSIDFVESFYFSTITLTQLGYGDIVPIGNGVRLVVSFQVITGVLIVLFGLHAVLRRSMQDLHKPSN